MRRGALALILALALVVSVRGNALAASSEELSGLSNREYVDYVHDRFEWLNGEARSSHRLAVKFHRQCKPENGDPDAARACEIAKAADEHSDETLQEGRDLMEGLQHRLGGVPAWAVSADTDLKASAGK